MDGEGEGGGGVGVRWAASWPANNPMDGPNTAVNLFVGWRNWADIDKFGKVLFVSVSLFWQKGTNKLGIRRTQNTDLSRELPISLSLIHAQSAQYLLPFHIGDTTNIY